MPPLTTSFPKSNVATYPSLNNTFKSEALPSISLITLILSIFYSLLALIDILSSPIETRLSLVLVALASSVALLLLYFLLKFNILSLSYLKITTVLIMGIALANSLAHFWITKDIIQGTNILIVVIILGSFLLSTSWVLIFVGLSWLGWGAIVVFTDASNLFYFGFSLFFASVLAVVIHYSQSNLLKNLAYLRTNLEKQSTHLESMMANITQSEERFRRLANASFEGIVIHDKDKILDANKSFGKLFGVEIDDIIGKDLIDLFAPKSLEIARANLKKGKKEVFEAFAKKRDGTIFPVEVITYDLPYEEGVVHIASLKDITKRKDDEAKLIASQQKLEQQNTELVRANKLKSAFLANMSHELRTPLTAVTGYAEVLFNQDFGPLNENQKQYAHDIYDAGIQLMELISRIFDLSKLEADKVTLHMQNVNVDSLIQSAFVIIRAQADAKGITLESTNCSTNQLFVDPVRIKQVLYNYLSNAVKFTPQSGVVKIIAEDIDKGVQVEVIDTGIGIAEKDIHQLFQPFSQIDNAVNRVYEGAGLGLSLSKRLIELHGGKVWVESKKGQGSTFAFWLPKASSSK